jgi:hypothetical protein
VFASQITPVSPLSNMLHITDPSQILGSSSAFEQRTFVALLKNVRTLGVAEIYQCRRARGDGCLKLEDGSWVMLEIKESLYFGTMCAAFVECIMAQRLCNVQTNRGLIVFERFGSDWIRAKRKRVAPDPWALFDRHIAEFAHIFRFDALQLRHENGVEIFTPRPAIDIC